MSNLPSLGPDLSYDENVPDGVIYAINPATMFHGPVPDVRVWPMDGWWHWAVIEHGRIVAHGETRDRMSAERQANG
jgi:hypothetical protein